MTSTIIAIIAALPFIVVPIATAIRVRRSRTLAEETAEPPANPPLVSVVIPARNEARNIHRCLTSVLETSYPNLEVIVVDDESDDGTGDIARSVAGEDTRVRVLSNEPPPEGWLGKQWACETGARASRGDIIFFADADTVHANDLVTRSVKMMRRRKAHVFSVAGRQELGSFWEKLIQPQVFAMMALRFGGTESVTRSRFVSSKLATGQCLMVERAAYEELGRHGLVKSHVADDMMLAQRFFARGKNVVMVAGIEQLSTRMYTSLHEIIDGWSKNVFAGGRDSAMLGALGRALYPLLLPAAPLLGVLPAMILIADVFVSLPRAAIIWAAITQAALLLWWIYVYRSLRESLLYALLSPLGAAMVFYIFVRAVLRGQRVTWKGRTYVSK